MGPIGQAVVNITNPIAILHRAPGIAAYSFIFKHPPNFREFDNLWLIVLSGIVWCILYGAFGWYADRGQAKSGTRVLFLLIAVPLLYKIITFGATSIEISNKAKDNEDFGKICHQVIDAKPNTDVWIRISSSKSGVIRLRSLESSQSCIGFRASYGPFQLAVGDPPLVTSDVPLSGGNKTCIGLTPAYKNDSPYGAEWSARVIDCTR